MGAVGLREDADVVLAGQARGLRDAVAQRAADARLDLLAQRLGADAVDEELQARLAARLPVLLGVAEDAGDRGDDLGRLLGRDEDVDPAGEARLACESPPPTRRLKPRVPSSAIAAESAMSLISPRAQSSAQPVTETLYLRGRFE